MKIVFQVGNVTGGYAFSANHNKITMSGYVENLPEDQKELAVFEAKKAREFYVREVEQKKQAGEKVNPLTIKREAVEKAKEATINEFGEELYNAVVLAGEANKGGNVSVGGKKKSTSKSPKAPETDKAVTDFDIDDLEKELASKPADDFDAELPDIDEVFDPFDEEM